MLKSGKMILIVNSPSDTTVYTRVVDRVPAIKAGQSRDDTAPESSFEKKDSIVPVQSQSTQSTNTSVIIDNFLDTTRREMKLPTPPVHRREDNDRCSSLEANRLYQEEIDRAKNRANEIIREAERMKASIGKPTGIYNSYDDSFFTILHMSTGQQGKKFREVRLLIWPNCYPKPGKNMMIIGWSS